MQGRLRAGLLVASVICMGLASHVLAHADVTVEEALDLIAYTKDLIVADVRERSEFCDEAGHISGAVNYPWTSGVLQERYEELPSDAPILVVCRSGNRSNQAADFLDSEGFTEVYDMLGGMKAWTYGTVGCKYSGGSGTAFAPYEIATAADLIALGETPEDYGKHFILTADIDLDPNLPGGKVFDRAVIAPDMDCNDLGFQGTAFSGVLDGGGHVISHLTIVGHDYLGLIGRVEHDEPADSTARIRNVGVEDVNISGSGEIIGGLLGHNDSVVVTHSYSDGKVSGSLAVGGLVGYNQHSLNHCLSGCTVVGRACIGGLVGTTYGTVAFSHSTGAVEGDSDIGGLVGLHRGRVSQSYSAGAVVGRNAVGGLVGCNGMRGARPSPGDIDRSYSLASVRGETRVSGLVGDNRYGSVSQCYSAGVVSGAEQVGGLVGSGRSDVTASFWDVETSGIGVSDFGQGKTTLEMQTARMFLDAGWDFVGETENGTEEIWRIDEGYDYPRLWWEPEAAEAEGVIELSAADFDAQVAEGVILVDFYATWCSFCDMQAPILDEVAERLGGQARVAKLDVDEARDIMQRYDITAIPTLIVFRDGLAVERFVGLTDADTLVAAVLAAIESDR